MRGSLWTRRHDVRSIFIVGLISVAALCAAGSASAGPSGVVDRERLKKAVRTPEIHWNFSYNITPGDTGDEPDKHDAAPDVTTLRAQLKGDDSDEDRWSALADAYRALGDEVHEKESIQKVLACRKRRADAHADDGDALASLGDALFMAGDDKGADEAYLRATAAPHSAWKGWAAAGDMLVLRAFNGLAEKRFLDLGEAWAWMQSGSNPLVNSADAARRFADACDRYDKAVSLAPTDIELRMRRFAYRGLRALHPEAGAAAPTEVELLEDMRKVVELRPNEPRFIACGAMLEIALDPRGPAASGRPIDEHSESAQRRIDAALTKLDVLAKSDDRAVSARALEGTGVLQYTFQHDAVRAEASLRMSLAKRPQLRDARSLLLGILKSSERWDDIAKVCRDWLGTGETAFKRLLLASAEAHSGEFTTAEKDWRAALALDPKGFETNVGVAALVLRRAAGDAELKEARALLDSAPTPTDPDGIAIESHLNAVCLGLSGDIDAAEKAARGALARDEHDESAREILAALGR
jgi:tetratricopeptide (TPR) repeat protein